MEKRKQRKSQRRSGNGELFMQLHGYEKPPPFFFFFFLDGKGGTFAAR